VVLLHELGGTLDSWDAVAPGLSEAFRVLRYDQRGHGLTEKVRRQFGNDDAVGDLEAMLAALDLPPPYHLVAVAAASTQVLRFMERHPVEVRSIVLCNPAPGVDPSRAGVLNERADLAERDGMRGVLSITLDKSYPPESVRSGHLRELSRALSRQRSGRLRARAPHAGGHQHAAPAAADQMPRHGGGRPPRHGAAAFRHAGAGEEDSRRPVRADRDGRTFHADHRAAELLALLRDFFKGLIGSSQRG